MMYNGSDSVYAYTFEYEKRPDCPVCGGESIQVDADADWTLEVLLEKLENRQDMYVHDDRADTGKSNVHPYPTTVNPCISKPRPSCTKRPSPISPNAWAISLRLVTKLQSPIPISPLP